MEVQSVNAPALYGNRYRRRVKSYGSESPPPPAL